MQNEDTLDHLNKVKGKRLAKRQAKKRQEKIPKVRINLNRKICLPPPPKPPPTPPPTPTTPDILPNQTLHPIKPPFSLKNQLKISVLEGFKYGNAVCPKPVIYIEPPLIVELSELRPDATRKMVLVTIPNSYIHCPVLVEVYSEKSDTIYISTEDIIDGSASTRLTCHVYKVR